MTQAARHSRWSLLALAALWSLDTGAQLPAAPRVVIESNPSQQQARPQQPQTQAAAPAPAATSRAWGLPMSLPLIRRSR